MRAHNHSFQKGVNPNEGVFINENEIEKVRPSCGAAAAAPQMPQSIVVTAVAVPLLEARQENIFSCSGEEEEQQQQ